jgi:colanic acid biosynthesis glycosyl transferase WcaI
VAAVIALAEDKNLRARLGAAARLRAKQKWDRISVIASLEREFLALPQRRAAAAVRPWPSTHSGRSIEQVATGTRRRPAPANRQAADLGRQPNSGANSGND